MTTTMPSSSLIISFDGNRIKYIHYRQQVSNFAATLLNSFDTNGLQGDLLPDQEFEEILDSQQMRSIDPSTGLQSPLIGQFKILPPVDPNTRPALSASMITREAIAVHSAQLRDWEDKEERQHAQSAARNTLKQAFLVSLSEPIKRGLNHPVHGLRLIQSKQILAYLDAKYLQPTVADFDNVRASINKAYMVGQNMDTFIQDFRDHLMFLSFHNETMSATDSINRFKEVISHSKLFDAVVSHYDLSHTTVASRSFEDLADAVLHHWESQPVAPTTVASFAGAATTAKTVEQQLADAQKTIKKLTAKASAMTPTAAAGSTDKPEKKPYKEQWCWYHGCCGHASTTCTENKDAWPAGALTATPENPCGGEMRKWKDAKAAKKST